MKLQSYCITVDCPVCGNECEPNHIVEINGKEEVTVNLSEFNCCAFHCSHCGATVYTGDVDANVDYEEGNSAEEEED